VQLTAQPQVSPPAIHLSWVQDDLAIPASYVVSRKAPSANSWTQLITLSGTVTSWTDSSVSVGTPYEYQVFKQASGYTGYGYVYAGINVPLTESRGKVLLVVDNSFSASLAPELARLQQDLVGDGWSVVRIDVPRSDSVTHVKSLIQSQFNADPANVNTVFLFGHVPVPYSGNISPDEHPDHKGAWPADAYYGVMNGTWTDSTVNTRTAADSRNWNVPGDGKFDQSTIPGVVDLMVGRVDLANLPGQAVAGGPPTFPDETTLLRQYLNKDHNFRVKAFDLPRRGILFDGFGDYGGYAFSASGWRNFAPFFGPNITYLPNEGTWLARLNWDGYLWAYACGPGMFAGMNGPGNTGPYDEATTTDLVNADIHAVFTMLFGSYFGDWDVQDDFARAALASPTYTLACCWSGSPHWYCQHMALGATIGFSTRLTQNNTATAAALYRTQTNSYANLVHIALLGDPTLRMHIVAPPSNLAGGTNANGVQLSWTASPDHVPGDHVYRATNPNGPFTRLSSALVPGTTFVDTSAGNSVYTYMVRSVQCETTPSGTYTNASEGMFITLAGAPPVPVPVRVNSIFKSPAGIVLSWSNQIGQSYDVLFKTNLLDSTWSDFGLNLSSADAMLSWTDGTSSAVSRRLYQVLRK